MRSGRDDQEVGDYRRAMVRGRHQGGTTSVAGVQHAGTTTRRCNTAVAQEFGEAGEEDSSVGREK